MGSKNSVAAASTPLNATPATQSPEPVQQETKSRVQSIRDDLLGSGLRAEALQYVKKHLKEHPNDTEAMALLAETANYVEKHMNVVKYVHWIDRLDILYEGIDATAKCLELEPRNGQCLKYFTLCAIKAADNDFYYGPLKPLGNIWNYERIMRRGLQSVEVAPDPEVCMSLATFSMRANVKWYHPYRLFGIACGVPNESEMTQQALAWHKKAFDLDPNNIENVCRMANLYWLEGDFAHARKWFSYARDEMSPQHSDDVTWTSIAHTHLTTKFPSGSSKPAGSKFNLPFG